MRKYLIAALALFVLLGIFTFPTEADADTFFIEQDKQKHMAYSAVATNLMYLGGMSKWQAFTTMMLVGAFKERMDDNTDTEHHRDMLANMVGASTVFVWKIEWSNSGKVTRGAWH